MLFTVDVIDMSQLYIEENNPFKKVSSSELKGLLKDYYTETFKTGEIISQHHLNLKTNTFAKNLPLVDSDQICPYDGSKMRIKLPSKASMDNWNEDEVCPKCNHIIFEKYNRGKLCSCINCTKRRAAEKKRLKTNLLDAQGDKRELVTLTSQDYLDLAVILQQLNAKSLKNIGVYSEHRRIGFDKVRVERLVAHHLLVVSEDSNNNALKILSDGSIEYDEASVNWHVWVTDDSDDNSRLLDELKNPNKINLLSDQEADDIYLQLARKELLKIFVMELETHRFDINSTDVSNLEIAIDHWLAFLTPAQIYAVIWRSVRHVNDERTKGTLGNYKYHLIHFIIKEGDYLITYLSDQGEEIKPYNFPRKVEKDLDTIIFFDQMIFLPNWFARKVPLSQGIVEMKNPRCLVGNTLEKISMQRITNLESIVAIVQDARWFKETDYGVVVNDGNVSWLFAEQLEVFNLMKAKGAVVNSHSRWLPEEFDYCINDFYSFRFIRHLLQALKNSTALNVTEDKSTMW